MFSKAGYDWCQGGVAVVPAQTLSLARWAFLPLALITLALTVLSSGCVSESVGATGSLIIFTELDHDTTTVWQASARWPESRTALARLEHREGFGIRGSVSPDDSLLAYTFIPVEKGEPVGGASLALLELGSGQSNPLIEGVDLHSRPVWSADSQLITFRRTVRIDVDRAMIELHIYDLSSGESDLLVSDSGAFGLYPIGFSQDGVYLYYSRITIEGSVLWRVASSGGEPELVAFLGAGIARDFSLSPGRSKLVYVMKDARMGSGELGVVDLESGGANQLQNGNSDYVSPVWHPRGERLTVGSVDKGSGISTISLKSGTDTEGVTSGSDKLDVPVAWSPDAAYLVLRSFQRTAAGGVTDEQLVVVSAEGELRTQVMASGYVEFLGWRAGQ
jgi:Tol biopolymer transport system component